MAKTSKPVLSIEELATGKGFALRKNGRPLKTPEGTPLEHQSRALLEAVVEEVGANGKLDLTKLSLHSMLCTLKQDVEPERARIFGPEGPLSSHCLLMHDLALRLCAGPEVTDQMARLGCLLEFLNENDLPYVSLPQTSFCDHQQEENRLRESGQGASLDRLMSFFDRRFMKITPSQHCVVTHSAHLHESFLLGMVLAEGRCSTEEYAEAIAAVNCVIPGVFADTTKKEARQYIRGIEQDARIFRRFIELSGEAGL